MKFLHQSAYGALNRDNSEARFINIRPGAGPSAQAAAEPEQPDPLEALEALALDETQTELHEQALQIALERAASAANMILTRVNDDLPSSELFTAMEDGIYIGIEGGLIQIDRPTLVVEMAQLNDLGISPETALTYFAAHVDEFRSLDNPVDTGALAVEDGPATNDTGALFPEDLDIEDPTQLVQDPETGAWVPADQIASAANGGGRGDGEAEVAARREDAEQVAEEAAETAAESYDINEAERNQVRNVQNLLNQAGFNAGGADGFVGPRTLGGLRSAQEAAGLDPESTTVTPQLVDFLNERIQNKARADYAVDYVNRNRSDADFVRAVQEAVGAGVDGSVGRETRTKIGEFMNENPEALEAIINNHRTSEHLEAARQALGAERAAEIDALIENGASIDELAALTDPEASGGMGNRNLVAQYLQAKYENSGQDFTELAVAIMEQYECPEGHTVRDALSPAQNGDDERYFRDFDRNGRESYYRVGYRVKQNELVRSVENSEVSLTVSEAYNAENNTITIGDQVVTLPQNARLHMATGNEAGRADGWMDMGIEQAGDFEISNVVYDEASGAIYFIMNNGCNGNPGVITVEQGTIPRPRPAAPAPAPTPRGPRVQPPVDTEEPTPEGPARRCVTDTRCWGGREQTRTRCWNAGAGLFNLDQTTTPWQDTGQRCSPGDGDDGDSDGGGDKGGGDPAGDSGRE